MRQEKARRKENNSNTSVVRNYKDSIFRMIFREKQASLNLYNALNQTDYHDLDALEINTLENAIYLGRRNDVSFIIYGDLNLYEHQSTVNPNMPLRSLLYLSSIYSKMIINQNLYGSKQVKIPRPHFVSFYNGLEMQPEIQMLKLSDAYEEIAWQKTENDCTLELNVLMININEGNNRELMDKCKELNEYTIYVERVRRYALTMELRDAVERAVQECIDEGILADFLQKNRAEVVDMSLFEYTVDEHLKWVAKENLEDGIAIGKAESILETLKDLGPVSSELSQKIMTEKRIEVLSRWLKLAVKAEDIVAFEEKMQEMR